MDATTRAVRIQQRSDSGELQRCAGLTAEAVQPLPQRLPASVEGTHLLGRIHLSDRDQAARHGDDVIVEGARVRQCIRATWIEAVHEVGSAAESAEGTATPEVFAECYQIGTNTEFGVQAA